jgi:hypothetical protein
LNRHECLSNLGEWEVEDAASGQKEGMIPVGEGTMPVEEACMPLGPRVSEVQEA